MTVVRCARGHSFDDEKFRRCPVCYPSGRRPRMLRGPAVPRAPISEDDVTRDMESSGDERTLGMYEYDPDEQRTIGEYEERLEMEPVVGWLVCVEGNEAGRDYRLFSGVNKAGKSTRNRIVIRDDYGLADENHFQVIFDPVDGEFHFKAGEKPCRVNGEVVYRSVPLHDSDEIVAGTSVFIFVAFCKGDRKW